MRAGSPTISDIAAAAGVSPTAVHYALHGTGTLSEQTRERILRLADELDYRPNRLARGLRTRRSATLGLIFERLDTAFHSHLLDGAQNTALTHEHSLLVGCSQESPQCEKELMELFLEKAVDGLLLTPADSRTNAEYYDRLLSQGLPLVFMDAATVQVEADVVATDNLLGGFLAARHLVELGRRHLVCLVAASELRRDATQEQRLQGCNQALAEAGLPPARVLDTDAVPAGSEVQTVHAAFCEYLHQGHPVDAVFATHDSLAYAALGALGAAGLRVPQDVSLVGFDDLDLSACLHPPLTTVRQDPRRIGAEAVNLLLRRLQEGASSLPAQRVLLVPTLIVRESCGAAWS